MKIAYLLHWNGGLETGVFKKIVAQTRHWQLNGSDVGVFIFSQKDHRQEWAKALGDIPVFMRTYSGFSDRFRQMNLLVGDVMVWCPDVVYARYDLFYPAIEHLEKNKPVVFEVNTDDIAEYKMGSKSRSLYNQATRSRMLVRSKGLVFVTEEMSKMKHFARYCDNYAVIANGIELEDYSPLPPAISEEPRLVFIGTPNQSWHGIDKVLWLAEQLPDWNFDLIGVNDSTGNLPSNVTAYGLLVREQYQSVMARADVAIGSMALHRKGLDEASPLKSREYLAYSIPMIIGYKDTDFPNEVPFILQLPNTEDNIVKNVLAIQQFVLAWKGLRVQRKLVLNIHAGVKELQRLQFFEEILDIARRSA